MDTIGKVLVIDDSETTNAYITDILSKHNFQVYSTYTGQETLNVLHAGYTPDLILMDILLPDTNGFSLYKATEEILLQESVPVVFLTGVSDEENIKKGLKLGAVDFITKPFREIELVLKIQNHFKFINITKKLKGKEADLQEVSKKLRESNLAKDRFFSIIAHDLRNPFNAILGISKLLSTNAHEYTPDKIEKLATSLSHTSQYTFDLLENLLAWARIQLGKMKVEPGMIEIKMLFAEVIPLFAEIAKQKKIELTNYSAENLKVFADKEMLKTIIRNLLSNAIKFTPKGGRVSMIGMKQGLDCHLIISDAGIGMREELVPDLFTLDSNVLQRGTANETGTGLGLVLCKEFVEINNGTISVDSKENEGSVFTITLPLVKLN